MDWISDATNGRVAQALGWTCDICLARVKHLCLNTIQPGKPLPGRVIHFGRLVNRSKAK